MILFSSFRIRERALRHAVAAGLFLTCLATLGTSGAAWASGIDAVKLQVNVPYAFLPALKGAEGAAFASEKKEGTFPTGRYLDLSFGSGMALREGLGDGRYRLLAVTDDGPTCHGPGRKTRDGLIPTRLYLIPGYSPLFVELTLDSRSRVLQVTGIRRGSRNSQPYSGIPPKAARSLSLDFHEEPVTTRFSPIEPRGSAINPQGLAVTSDGTIWVADASLPSVVRLSNRDFGEISRAIPGKGLPRFLAWSAMESGFQGLAQLPNGKLATTIKPERRADYAVILLSDPSDWTSRAYVYPKPSDLDRFSLKAFASVGDGTLFAVESGETDRGRAVSRLVRISFKGADDLSEFPLRGGSIVDTPLRYLKSEGVTPVRRDFVADLIKAGVDKPISSLVRIDDETLLAVNESHYGVRCRAAGGAALPSLRLSPDGDLMKNGKVLPDEEQAVTLHPTGNSTNAWLLKFPKPFTVSRNR